MKLITAIIRPNLIDRLVVALEAITNFPGITVTEVEGFGQLLQTEHHDSLNPFRPHKRIEIVANDEITNEIIAAIRKHAHTGKIGDGILFVLPIDESFLL